MVNVFGLGSILLWQWLTVLRSGLFAPSPTSLFPDPGAGYILFSLALCGTFLSLARWGTSLSGRGFRAGLWIAAGLMSLVWLPDGTRLREIPLLGPLLFLTLPAVGSATQLAAWEWRLCDAPFPRQALAFGLACAVRTGGILLVLLLFPPLLPALAIFLPFLGAFLWTPPGGDPGAPSPLPRPGATLPPRLALRAGSFFAVSAMFLSVLLNCRTEPMALAQELSDPLYSLGALGVGSALLRLPGLELRRIHVWAEAFLVLGFIALAALGAERPLVPLALLQLGAGIFGAYIFTLLLYLGNRAGRGGALPVVAMGQTALSGSTLLGMLLTRAAGPIALREGIPLVLASSLLGIGLLFFFGLLFRDDRNTFAGYDLRSRDPDDGTSALREPEEPPAGEAEGDDGKEEREALRLRLLRGELSRQEVRVALLVARGLTNEEISRELNITGNTVRTHLRNIHRKMGSGNRKELQEQILRTER